MTADNDSLLNQVFAALGPPPVGVDSGEKHEPAHYEFHSSSTAALHHSEVNISESHHYEEHHSSFQTYQTSTAVNIVPTESSADIVSSVSSSKLGLSAAYAMGNSSSRSHSVTSHSSMVSDKSSISESSDSTLKHLDDFVRPVEARCEEPPDETISVLKYQEHVHEPLEDEISEEIVHNDAQGNLAALYPDDTETRSPLQYDLMRDLRSNQRYLQNHPDTETNSTISDAHVESVFGIYVQNQLTKEDDSYDDEEDTGVLLRSVVKRDFDSVAVISVENPAIKRQPSHTKPLDERLKTELIGAMQTRAINDEEKSETVRSHSESQSHEALDESHATGVYLHRDAENGDSLRSGSLMHSERSHSHSVASHHTEFSGHQSQHLEESHSRRDSQISQKPTGSFVHHNLHDSHEIRSGIFLDEHHEAHNEFQHASEAAQELPHSEPQHWEPRRFSESSRGSGFEHVEYIDHGVKSDDEATLTSEPEVNDEVRKTVKELTEAIQGNADDLPPYFSKKESTTYSSRSSSVHSASVNNQSSASSQRADELPVLGQIPRLGAFAHRRDTHSSLANSEHSTLTEANLKMSEVYKPSDYGRRSRTQTDQFSTVSSIALVPNTYDHPRVRDDLRPVKKEDLKFSCEQLHKRQPHEMLEHIFETASIHEHHDYHDHQVYDDVSSVTSKGQQSHKIGYGAHADEPLYLASEHSHHSAKPCIYTARTNPLRGTDHLPVSERFLLTEGVNTLRGRWEAGNFRSYDTDDEYTHTIAKLDAVVHSQPSEISKSRSSTTSASEVSTTTSCSCQESNKSSQAKSVASKASISKSATSCRSSKVSAPSTLKSRASTLQNIDEHNELAPPQDLDHLQIDVTYTTGPLLGHAPVTSPDYDPKFQSVRVVKNVRQFAQQWSNENFIPAQRYHDEMPVPYVRSVLSPVKEPVPTQRLIASAAVRRDSVLSNATSVSVNSSVSQQSSRRAASRQSVEHAQKVPSLPRSAPRSQSNTQSTIQTAPQSAPRSQSNTQSTIHASVASKNSHGAPAALANNVSSKRSSVAVESHHVTSKRSSIASTVSTLKNNEVIASKRSSVVSFKETVPVNGHLIEDSGESPLSPAAHEKHKPSEIKVRAETIVLADLLSVAQRRAFFEKTEDNEPKNFELPPMVNVLE